MAGVIIAIIAIYAIFDPAEGFFPRCPVKMLTGFDCPGCGSQRAIHALLHGRIAQAWSLNPLMLILAPYALAVVVLEATPTRMVRLRRILTSTAAITATLLATILWVIARNLYNL